MTKDLGAERFKRLQVIKQQVAKALGLPLDDDKVEQCSFLKLLREGQMERYIDGGHGIDVRAYLELDRTINEVMPPPATTVTLEIVPRTRVECPSCHVEFNTRSDNPKPLPPAERASDVPEAAETAGLRPIKFVGPTATRAAAQARVDENCSKPQLFRNDAPP